MKAHTASDLPGQGASRYTVPLYVPYTVDALVALRTTDTDTARFLTKQFHYSNKP